MKTLDENIQFTGGFKRDCKYELHDMTGMKAGPTSGDTRSTPLVSSHLQTMLHAVLTRFSVKSRTKLRSDLQSFEPN